MRAYHILVLVYITLRSGVIAIFTPFPALLEQRNVESIALT